MKEFLGVKSWAELEKTSRYVSVEREEQITKIYPHRIGRGGGFEPFGDVITCKSTDAYEIGNGILKAFKIDGNGN